MIDPRRFVAIALRHLYLCHISTRELSLRRTTQLTSLYSKLQGMPMHTVYTGIRGIRGVLAKTPSTLGPCDLLRTVAMDR